MCRWNRSSDRAGSSSAKAVNVFRNFFNAARGIAGEGGGVEPFEQLSVAVGEHRVVQRMLRVEVLIQRRLAHPDLSGQIMQGQPGDALLASELPSRGDDRGDLGLSTQCDLPDRHPACHRSRPSPALPRSD